MLRRILGQETEYAIRFTPALTVAHPGNEILFQALKESLAELVSIRPGFRSYLRQHFMENGGAFSYEHLPWASTGGLLEMATPECSSPSELLLYQRAQESLLMKAIPLARERLKKQGFRGNLGLIKNCRDEEGHIYGAQENYEAAISSSRTGLLFYRLSVAFSLLLMPLYLITEWLSSALLLVLFFAYLLSVLTIVLLILLLYLPLFLIPLASFRSKGVAAMDSLRTWFFSLLENERVLDRLIYAGNILVLPSFFLASLPFTLWFRFFGFRPIRRGLEAFLLSRFLISGAGTLLDPEGNFALSEKGTAINRISRFSALPASRPVYDNGNILKSLIFATKDLLLLRPASLGTLFRPRQRLQLGLSDSNRAQVAEFLKVGCTLLLMDMAEEGSLGRHPVLRSPLRALRTMLSDPTARAKVPVRWKGKEAEEAGEPSKTKQEREPVGLTSLELQRFYLDRARSYLSHSKEVPLEYHEVVRLWEEMLSGLEEDPGRLVGRLDWVTKRYLLETAGRDLGFTARKKIDIAYHELGQGYFDILEREGIAPMLVEREEQKRAETAPPSHIQAKIRSEVIRSPYYEGNRMKVSWNSVVTGPPLKRKVLSLEEFRKRMEREQPPPSHPASP